MFHGYSGRKQVQKYQRKYIEMKTEWENSDNDFLLTLGRNRELGKGRKFRLL